MKYTYYYITNDKNEYLHCGLDKFDYDEAYKIDFGADCIVEDKEIAELIAQRNNGTVKQLLIALEDDE